MSHGSARAGRAAHRLGTALLVIAVVLALGLLTPNLARAGHSDRSRTPLDVAVAGTGVSTVWTTIRDRQGFPMRGHHVIVGVLDTGIDYGNPDFTNPDGTSRILAIWDQTAKNAPRGFHTPSPYGYGYVCLRPSLENGTCPERDLNGHGTHVTGIAAGNGRCSTPARYVGVANQADIVFVRYHFLDTKSIADGVHWMMGIAAQMREPIAVNLSVGGEHSPHDGSEPATRVLDTLPGPGRIVVVAAGNAANDRRHAATTVIHQGQTEHVLFDAHDTTHGVLWVYFHANDELSATVTNLVSGQTFGPTVPGTPVEVESADKKFKVTLVAGRADQLWNVIGVVLTPTAGELTGRFDLAVRGDAVSTNGRFNVWSGDSLAFEQADPHTTLGTPADARNVITVANYTTRTRFVSDGGKVEFYCAITECPASNRQRLGNISVSSAWGPTTDGRQKPDIAAPGGLIISSRARNLSACPAGTRGACIPAFTLVNHGRNEVSIGTSQAAPFVTGVVALMLQMNPGLNESQVKNILRRTARHDVFTGYASWNPQWGAGKIDALAAVLAAQPGK